VTAATGTYLDRIVADVSRRLGDVVVPAVERGASRSMCATIGARRDAGEVAIIAEVKRRSPSVGAIAEGIDPAERAHAYESAGAAGISVLTEPDHFGGALEDLASARVATATTPLLRKDFVIDARQLEAARAAGADVVLLIAALHDEAALRTLVDHAHGLDLEVLLEVHDEPELERALATDAVLIGINNRDLRSFGVDLAVTERLAPLVPEGRLVVAESGVKTTADAARLRAAGVDALLVGEALMRAQEPGGLLRALATATKQRAGAAP
jgi:indole-3-glycerol phosphate synthase